MGNSQSIRRFNTALIHSSRNW